MTVIQPRPQMFSLLLLPFHLSSGMLDFHLTLRVLAGAIQTVSSLPVQPHSTPPACVCKTHVRAIPTTLSDHWSQWLSSEKENAEQFRPAPFTLVSAYPWWLSVIVSNLAD